MELKTKITLQKKGNEAYLPVRQLLVKLKWRAAVDLDLMAFYKTKDGRTGGIFSDNYSGGSLGDLNRFPFMELSGDAGVGGAGGDNEEVLRVTQLDEMETVYICALNFSGATSDQGQSFAAYDGHVEIMDDKGESFGIPLDSRESGAMAVVARIDNANVMGAKLINENRILSMEAFQSTIPGGDKLRISSKIVLKQKGDAAPIPLRKLQVTLRWKTAVDLDLHAFYKLKPTASAAPAPKRGLLSRLLGGGGATSPQGHVYFNDRGRREGIPGIYLDQDAGVGDAGGDNEENLYFSNLEPLLSVLIVANIYNKPDSTFSRYDGVVILQADDQTIEVPLTAPQPGSWCVVAEIDYSEAQAKLINVNHVQSSPPVP